MTQVVNLESLESQVQWSLLETIYLTAGWYVGEKCPQSDTQLVVFTKEQTLDGGYLFIIIQFI